MIHVRKPSPVDTFLYFITMYYYRRFSSGLESMWVYIYMHDITNISCPLSPTSCIHTANITQRLQTQSYQKKRIRNQDIHGVEIISRNPVAHTQTCNIS